MKKKITTLLLAASAIIFSGNVYAWGSDIKFIDMPESTSIIDNQPPSGIIFSSQAPSVNGGELGDISKYTQYVPNTGTNDTGDLGNGYYYVYLFRNPNSSYVINQVCKVQVADWKSGAFNQNHHYCVHTIGACQITGNNNGNMMLSLKGQAPNQSTSAGNCSN